MGGKLTQKNGRRLAGGKPIPKSDFALPGKNAYPIDTAKRARNALSRIAQYGTPAQQATVQRAVKRRYQGQVNVTTHSNEGPGMRYDFAGGGAFACPNCGYSGSPDDFRHNDGDYDNDSARRDGSGITPGALRTPAAAPTGRGTVPLTVRGASSGNLGLANQGQRAVNLARRLPVRALPDIVVSRNPDGTATVRHRTGGNEVGTLKRTADGWVSTVGGQDSDPVAQQRTALLGMFGSYNRDVAANPFQAPPVQTPLMQQFGVPAIRLASADDEADDNDSASSDSNMSGGNGLNPRGQSIYKKLCAKGVKPAVAMAMAKRAQNTKPGQFGGK